MPQASPSALRNLYAVVVALLAMTVVLSTAALAGQTKIAVAANFTDAAKEIGALFEQKTGHKAVFSFGSTGQLYAQITQDAPFEVFLAADRARPQKAEEQGHAVAGSRFTYATGKIVLFSTDAALVKGEATLRQARFAKLAIANPATAPYGAAAVEAMKALGVYDALAPRIVQGNNIAQTWQFIDTGNAELGFVALSQVAGHDRGSRWLVPESLHATIAQDAVLLERGANDDAAKAFVAFLRGPGANAIKEKYGYGTGN
jgi:molybdate transport system substrate-binding protein